MENIKKIGQNSCSNIVHFFGTCTMPRRRKGIVLELFEANLMEHINPPISLREGIPIMRQLANGLSHLRRLNIVHRDVKPDNILVKQERRRLVVALTDLGVSKHMSKTQRSNQTNVGTDLWMAPEVKGDRPNYGHPSDVYGFGLTSTFILTGSYPMGKDVSPEDLVQWIGDCFNKVSWDDASLLSLINGCLEYNPRRRIDKGALVKHEVSN